MIMIHARAHHALSHIKLSPNPQAQTSSIHMESTTTATLSQDSPFLSPLPFPDFKQASMTATRIKKKQGVNVLTILLL